MADEHERGAARANDRETDATLKSTTAGQLAPPPVRDPQPTAQSPTTPRQAGRVVTMIEASSFSGPLPLPEMLEQYNRAFDGCAERIVKMAEDQSHHRRAIEKTVIESKIRSETRGQAFAFSLGLTGLASATYLVSIGRSVEGFGVFLVSLGSLVGVFLAAQRKQAKELEEKRSAIDRPSAKQ